jgi:enoyl-CoA hydratase/3-hydroxyacyl-CoA dehydrogenase
VRLVFVRVVGLAGGGELAEAVAAAGFEVAQEDLGAADLVLVEDASFERLAQLDERVGGHTILALLDHADQVSELAEAVSSPERLVGFRLAGARLVEVVEGDETSDETAQAAVNFAQALRRQAIRCLECPGLVVERVANAEDPLAEACWLVEAGISGIREIDMATGRPFSEADAAGLDTLADPPALVKRLIAQGRTGRAAGHGFFPHPPAGDGPVIVDDRGEVCVLWLANPPANSLGPPTVDALRAAWDGLEARVVVLASASPALFCAGADIKAFTQMDEAAGRRLLDDVHALVGEWERSRIATVAAVNGLAFGGGCELAMACDVRVAAESATFGQPEINLGIIPGFGGTQRLPRLVGHAKALEMNLTGEAISAHDAFAHGLVNQVVPDHELFDAALNYARKLAGQAPVAIEQIKRASGRGMDAEKEGFLTAFGSADAREGLSAFVEKRKPRWSGE